MEDLNLAYVGCGAVVEKNHLPAVQSTNYFLPSVLIDTNADQRKRLCDKYEIAISANCLDDVISDFQVAVVATPSANHYAITKKLLAAGKHVLVEKPLSLRLNEAQKLIELAETEGVILGVGLVRRYFPAYRVFQSLLSNKVVGEVLDFELEEGFVFNWPVQSPAFYNPEISGGGVLVDTGSHVLDACLWWLGDYEAVEYYDDNQGGVEAECHLDIKLVSGAQGSISLSRLRNLSNRITVNGSKGTVSLNFETGEIMLRMNNTPTNLVGYAQDSVVEKTPSIQSFFELQYKYLYHSIHDLGVKSSNDLVMARDCLPSIRLMEECYENRKSLPFLLS